MAVPLPAHSLCPNQPAPAIGQLTTFTLPSSPHIAPTPENRALGHQMVQTWRKDGIFQIQLTPDQASALRAAFVLSKSYFKRPHHEKAKHVDDQSFSGYIASGEELTDGIADYSEIFTVTKDLALSDPRVQQKWPCHGPCPWPDTLYESAMKRLMAVLGDSGEKLLQLTALGLNLANPNVFTDLTDDGWHHMRVLRFPQADKTNGKGKPGRGIGAHTDYGLLVIAGQDDVGGLFVRPPTDGDTSRNWEKYSGGLKEDQQESWSFVPPVENVLTVFPGDMMQYMTNDYLPSTPHKVVLNTRERYAFAYFHEPNFSSVVQPLPEYGRDQGKDVQVEDKGIHYGTHFTEMFMRNYPERVTAKRMKAENRLDILGSPLLRRHGKTIAASTSTLTPTFPLTSAIPPTAARHPHDAASSV